MGIIHHFFLPDSQGIIDSKLIPQSPGAFDIIAEFLPHLTLILYRLNPDRPHFLIKIFRLACLTELAGTISETAVTMWLFGSLWDRWTLPFKIVTPLLHCLFAAAQLWGAYVFVSQPFSLFLLFIRFCCGLVSRLVLMLSLTV